MKKSRKIDDIFRQNLGNAETTPPAEVWQNILDRLPEEKQQKRLIPFWYPLAGTAAAIAILFLIFNNNNSSLSQQPVNPRVSYDLQNMRPEIIVTSAEFEEAMWKSSINLEAARLYNRNSIPLTGNSSIKANFAGGRESKTAALNSGEKKSGEQREEKLIISVPTPYINNGLAEEVIKEEQKELQEEIVDLGPLLSKNSQIAEEEVKEESGNKSNLAKRFSITTTAGAIYFDNLGSGNTVDARFAGNQNSGELSMSYGVNLAYQLSEKVKVRSGVNKVDLRQNTSEVDFASAINSRAVNSEAAAASTLYSSVRGNLNQQLGFIEVPVEIEYALINKKLGFSLIGGGSALFLEENALSLDAANFSTDLGEANNLNSTSYSANLGVGIHYNISSQFRFNVEPIIKYQLNTFTDTPNLTPYYFGIYSGLSFRF